VKQIGRELDVRYVLEGSVQRGGNRLRINAQLIDAGTGNHLWAERFDKPVADLFDMQDEIVSRLANALDTQLIAAEARRSQRSLHPDAMDLFFQGKACWNKGLAPQHLSQARDFFERALTLDPNNTEALVGVAQVDTALAANLFTNDRIARLAEAETVLIEVLSVAPNHALAHLVLAIVQIFSNRAAQGIAECERALALDRNLATAHAFIGLAKYALGHADETEGHILEALRIPSRYLRLSVDDVRRLCEVVAQFRRRCVGLVPKGPRSQPQYPQRTFPSRSCLGAAGRVRAGAGRGACGTCTQPKFHHPHLSQQRGERQSILPRGSRARP
jgi:tetratricopeptide (TPR) repeat protein